MRHLACDIGIDPGSGANWWRSFDTLWLSLTPGNSLLWTCLESIFGQWPLHGLPTWFPGEPESIRKGRPSAAIPCAHESATDARCKSGTKTKILNRVLDEFGPFWGPPLPSTFHNVKNHGGGRIARERRTKENKENNTMRKTKTNRNEKTKKDTKQKSPCFFLVTTSHARLGVWVFKCLGG